MRQTTGIVLIVEDNRSLAETLGNYLESQGFDVDYAADGLEGYRLAAENHYDAIVLDGNLPRLDGLELLEVVKEIDAAARAVERATGRAELASAHVELVALADITVRVGDTAVDLATDGDWVTAIAEPTVIEVPGVLRARVSPGTDALQTHAELEAAHRVLAELLEKAGVAEVPAAHALDERRRELGAARSAAQATVAALTDHDGTDHDTEGGHP